MKKRSLFKRIRQRVRVQLVEGAFYGLAYGGRMVPAARPERHGVEVLRDITYVEGSRVHTLDVYRPVHRVGLCPAVLYVHGGAFAILSKDTHWLMGLILARRGYVVFNVNYRLAPKHPYPAAVSDACAAAVWVQRHMQEYDADPTRLVFSGESAGGNLACALTVASTYRRPELYARAVWDSGITPRAVIAACGILQVSDTARFSRRRNIPDWTQAIIARVETDYLGGFKGSSEEAAMADPLLILEKSKPDRPLPPFFAFAGTKDPLLEDTRRLGRAVQRHGGICDTRVYPGGVHAFHALIWSRQARRCWGDQLSFLKRHTQPIESG